jgi:hypothetical protein
MLIDEYLPEYHASERHATVVHAAPIKIYTALRTSDFGSSLIMRGLLGLRAVPALFAEPHRMRRELRRQVSATSLTLNGFLKHGFALLAEDPGREIVIGLVGRFWRASGGLLATDATRFRQALPPRTAKAAWNFSLEELTPGRTRVVTETRILCADPASLRAFRCYWLLVRPFSGLLRRLMLHALRKGVEKAAD